MTTAYDIAREALRQQPRTWLITGVAGFIGCNLLETLLSLDQTVVGVDNFSTGHRRNISDVLAAVGRERAGRFRMVEGDVTDVELCREAASGVDYVLHQAALGSVPRSLEDPIRTNRANVDGFLAMLVASRDAGVERFVFAGSSSTYGDNTELPKVEEKIGRPLSPYAVTKYVNELYADVFARSYGVKTVGLRYFNVFGPRQDPHGAYAAVIPRWIRSMLAGEPVRIFGDGETSRDFSFVDNIVQANVLAAVTTNPEALCRVYNIAAGERTTLNALYRMIEQELRRRVPHLLVPEPLHGDFRVGDVRHSLADTSAARALLGYRPTHTVCDGLRVAMDWYVADLAPQ